MFAAAFPLPVRSVTDAREHLLDGAAAVLARTGYLAASFEDAAHWAGMPAHEMHEHFSSKEDLFLSVLDRIAEEWLEYMAVLERSPRPVPARLHQILVLRVLFRYDRLAPMGPGLAEMLAALRPAYLARSLGHFEREAKLLESVLTEGLQARTLARISDAGCTARTMILATNSLLPHCLRQRDWNDREALERNAAGVATLLVRSVVRLRKVRA